MIAAGLEIGGTWLRACTIGAGGVVGDRIRVEISDDPAGLSDALASLWERCGALRVVGVAAAPELDERGVVRRWPSNPRYEGADACGALHARGIAPLVLDDASAAAAAEHLAATELHDLPSSTALLSVGTGVGGGAVLADQLWLGARGQAMDLGHVKVPSARGVACGCGRVGCLQAVASGRALDRAAQERGLPRGGLARRASEGDVEARAVLEPAIPPLAEAITILARALDPDRIVVSGGLAEGGYLVDRLAHEAAREGCPVPVVGARWGTWAGALGAAVEAVRRRGESVRRLREAGTPACLRLALVQGPNLNLLGEREPEHYGAESFQVVEARAIAVADELRCELSSVQANGEAELVDWLQRRRGRLDGVVLNPAGLTAHGHALCDALLAARIPFVEVHLSRIDAREPIHRESCFASVARGRISGLGALGYEMALRALVRILCS